MKNLMRGIVYFLSFLVIMMAEKTPKIIYDFNKSSDMRDWVVVDDGVMGGVSSGSIRLDKSGNGLYSGYISLDNYGGFSSIRLRQRESNVDRYEYLVIGLYRDNKNYQFRINSKYYDRHVYGYKFFAKDEWQEIKIPLSSMKPQFRGRSLRMNNFNSKSIVEFGILIGNKVEENFSLLIDYIAFE